MKVDYSPYANYNQLQVLSKFNYFLTTACTKDWILNLQKNIT